MRKKGKIATWKDEKGYGFIEPLDGGSRLFVHISAFANGNRRPAVGDIVTYAVAKDNQGRLRAEDATLPGDKLRREPRRKSNARSITVSLLFFALIGASTLLNNVSPLVLAAYTVMSVIAYVAYAIDKSAAQRGRWRTSEGTLHVFALLGGWPGALIAQETLRHKSSKVSFRVVFWATVLINCAALVWLHTDDGQQSLDQLVTSKQAFVGGVQVTLGSAPTKVAAHSVFYR